MIKPKRLHPGDKVALVSLSSGYGGEPPITERTALGMRRLKTELGLEPVVMPNALKGVDYLDRHPEARAADLMEAFADPQIRAVISVIGGDDTIRLLPYINFTTVRNNPKIFMGFSDTTINHFMLRKAGVVSFYGPALLTDFAENVSMHPYTVNYLRKTLFEANPPLSIVPSPAWTSEYLDWSVSENSQIARTMTEDPKGFIPLQGKGMVSTKLSITHSFYRERPETALRPFILTLPRHPARDSG